jgi:hypothetical protein
MLAFHSLFYKRLCNQKTQHKKYLINCHYKDSLYFPATWSERRQMNLFDIGRTDFHNYIYKGCGCVFTDNILGYIALF